jgi:hypothetical protein
MLQPLRDAVARISAKTPIGSTLRSAEWARVPLALRERAQFSAAVTSVRLLQSIQDRLSGQIRLQREQLASGKTAMFDRSSFINAIRDTARAEGVETIEAPGERGTVKDIQSIPRLGLIYDMQNAQANGFARFKLDQTQGALLEFPAWEFVRVEARRQPRADWTRRWVEAGGQMVDGRMIALKTDSVWQALSIFGTPWPPFDWGSGMGLEEVDYDEAVALGLLSDGQIPEPTGEKDFNESLQASMKDVDPRYIKGISQLFGDMVDLVGDDLVWRSEQQAPAPPVDARPPKVNDDLVTIQKGVERPGEKIPSQAKIRVAEVAAPPVDARPPKVNDDLVTIQKGKRTPGEGIPSERSGVTENVAGSKVHSIMMTKNDLNQPPELMDKQQFIHNKDHSNWPWVAAPQVDVGSTGVFWRKGPPPEGGKSFNFKEKFFEQGVSAYFSPDPTSFAGIDDRPWYRVIGQLLGYGSDNEPLLRVESSRKASKNDISKALKQRQELHLKPGDTVFVPSPDYESFTDKYTVKEELRRADGVLYGYRIASGFGDAQNPSYGPNFLDLHQTGVRFAPEGDWTKKSHEWILKRALDEKKPVCASAIDAYGIDLPKGYIRSGDRYIPT